MKKNLYSIKASRSPHGQLLYWSSSIKVAFTDEPEFEGLETNCIKLYIKTKHPECLRGPYLSFLRYLLSFPGKASSFLLIYAPLVDIGRTEHKLLSAHIGAFNT